MLSIIISSFSLFDMEMMMMGYYMKIQKSWNM